MFHTLFKMKLFEFYEYQRCQINVLVVADMFNQVYELLNYT